MIHCLHVQSGLIRCISHYPIYSFIPLRIRSTIEKAGNQPRIQHQIHRFLTPIPLLQP